VEAFITRLKETPVIGPVVCWAERHPRLAAWAVLAVGMVVILLIEARDVGLEFGQWLALVVATVLVAGACIWIVSWEDEDEEEKGEGETDANEPEVQQATDDTPDVPAE